MIPFNLPSITDIEKKYIAEALATNKLCGDGSFTKKVGALFKDKLGVSPLLLTTSCTHALDMTAILADLKPGDEVIVPSYTFVSTVNAAVLRGAHPVFCDVESSTMNMDVSKVEALITEKTKAIYPVHYAGVSCDMDALLALGKKYNIAIIEDAAQAVGSTYKGKPCGTIGDMGCYSFHETKNYAMGEGGALIVKDPETFKRAEILREKGTDRSQFIRGEIDKYTWQSIGSSFLPSDVLAAMLYGQMERFEEIMDKRMSVWNRYHEAFADLEKAGKVIRPFIPDYTTHNAHMYYLILPTRKIRDTMITTLREEGVQSVFHYIPLHTSPMGQGFGYREGSLPVTEEYAGRLIRLPMWADLTDENVNYVIDKVTKYIQEA